MCLTHENGKDDAEMEQLYLMPGDERYTKFQDENGVPKIRYTYCSLHGKLFNCVSQAISGYAAGSVAVKTTYEASLKIMVEVCIAY